jgi:hypothetical protein
MNTLKGHTFGKKEKPEDDVRTRLRAHIMSGGLDQSLPDLYEAAKSERDQAIARAERAEASLHALRLVCGTTDADKFTTWVDRAKARAERAEAEVERLRECCDKTAALCGKFITEDDGTDLTPNPVRIGSALQRLTARAERAEAELAAERARLADLISVNATGAARLAHAKVQLKAEREKVQRLVEINEFVGSVQLKAEREKVRALRLACERIVNQWDADHDTNPIGAGGLMYSRASFALAATEDAQ